MGCWVGWMVVRWGGGGGGWGGEVGGWGGGILLVRTPDEVLAKNPSHADPLEHGLRWTVVRREVEARCPDLPRFLPEAGDVGHGVERQQTKLQCLLQAHMLGNGYKTASGDYNWEEVAKRIEQQSPHLSGQVLDMCTFVAKYSGGTSVPTFLRELDRWSKTQVVRSDVASTTWRQLGGVDLTHFPETVIAMTKAALSSPSNYVRNGVSVLLTGQDVTNFATKWKASTITLSTMTKMARSFYNLTVKDTQGNIKKEYKEVTEANFERTLGEMQIRAVLSISGKKGARRVYYSTLKDIQYVFWQEMMELCPNLKQSNVECPFGELTPPAKGKAAGKGKSAASIMINYNANGSIAHSTLEELGFVTGATIELKKPDDERKNAKWTIKAIDAEGMATLEIKLGDLDKDVDDSTPVRRRLKGKASDHDREVRVPTGVLLDDYKAECDAKFAPPTRPDFWPKPFNP